MYNFVNFLVRINYHKITEKFENYTNGLTSNNSMSDNGLMSLKLSSHNLTNTNSILNQSKISNTITLILHCNYLLDLFLICLF